MLSVFYRNSIEKMEDKKFFYFGNYNAKEFAFTAKGRNVLITLKNGKRVTAKVERCIGGHADVKFNNKTVLINSNFREIG